MVCCIVTQEQLDRLNNPEGEVATSEDMGYNEFEELTPEQGMLSWMLKWENSDIVNLIEHHTDDDIEAFLKNRLDMGVNLRCFDWKGIFAEIKQETKDWKSSQMNYLEKSLDQIIRGPFSNNVTLLGTVGSFALCLIPGVGPVIGFLMSGRNFIYAAKQRDILGMGLSLAGMVLSALSFYKYLQSLDKYMRYHKLKLL